MIQYKKASLLLQERYYWYKWLIIIWKQSSFGLGIFEGRWDEDLTRLLVNAKIFNNRNKVVKYYFVWVLL